MIPARFPHLAACDKARLGPFPRHPADPAPVGALRKGIQFVIGTSHMY